MLLLLRDGPAHGYELMDRLTDVFPGGSDVPDISTVYRSLADAEAQGAVQSEWAAGDGGGRKVYRLTKTGEDLLGFWAERFHVEQQGLVQFLRRYRKTRPRKRMSASTENSSGDTAGLPSIGEHDRDRRAFLGGAVGLVGVALLSACSGGDSSHSSGSASTASITPPADKTTVRLASVTTVRDGGLYDVLLGSALKLVGR